jgi:hypothetical protein
MQYEQEIKKEIKLITNILTKRDDLPSEQIDRLQIRLNYLYYLNDRIEADRCKTQFDNELN